MKGHEIVTKVNKDDNITITFDEARDTWKALDTTVPSLIVRLAFIPGTSVSLTITPRRTSLLGIRGTYKISCS